MDISLVNKSNSIQPQKLRDTESDPARNLSTEENPKYVHKNKVDSLEISSSHSGAFDDKRLTVAKSAILYEVSVKDSPDRVSELRDAIAKGDYEVPSNLLADALLK